MIFGLSITTLIGVAKVAAAFILLMMFVLGKLSIGEFVTANAATQAGLSGIGFIKSADSDNTKDAG